MPLEQADNLAFKKIKLELLSRSTAGIIRAEDGSRSLIRLLRVPHENFAEWRNSGEMSSNYAIYFLTWELNHVNHIYVGRSTDPRLRFPRHRGKPWKVAYVLTTSDDSFTEADLAYLERAFYDAVKEIGVYKNSGRCRPPSSDRHEDWVEEPPFWKSAFALLEILGCMAFRKVTSADETTPDSLPQFSRVRGGDPSTPTHYYKGRNGVYARLNIAEDGKATLLKGSIIIRHPTASDKPVVAELIEKRNERARDLADNDEHTLRVVNDISFDSRNQAARFIVCNSINAREKLKPYRPRNRHD